MVTDPSEPITLRLTRESAEALYGRLWDLDEHWAAGGPVPYPNRNTVLLMRVVWAELEFQLGKINPTEVMRRGLEERGILQTDEEQAGE
jgi:hypothetical protein